MPSSHACSQGHPAWLEQNLGLPGTSKLGWQGAQNSFLHFLPHVQGGQGASLGLFGLTETDSSFALRAGLSSLRPGSPALSRKPPQLDKTRQP